MLSPYRVLDLTDDRGQAAGFLLAQFGADVIAVEPVEGSRARQHGPFADDRPDPEGSLSHWAYNRGKRSVRYRSPEQLAELADGADVVLDCGAVPVDLGELRRRNPALVTLSFSPFGADGPKAGWAATDLTLVAASGQLALTGDSDRAPVRISVPQAWLNAAAEGACAVLLALNERATSGLGQHIDVSAAEAMMLSCQGWTVPALSGSTPAQRLAGGLVLFDFVRFQFVHPCQDGHVCVTFLPGILVGPYTNRLLAWLESQGLCPPDLAANDWTDLLGDLGLEAAAEVVTRTGEVIGAALATKTKDELFAATRTHRLLMVPISTSRDVLETAHFRDRGAWDEVNVAGRQVSFPGPYLHCADAPMARLGPPPRLGEHDETIAAEPPRRPATPPAGTVPKPPGGRRPALEGIKVVDFTWVYAGPFATRMLAYHGATVVRVESATRPDQVRGAGISRLGDGGPEDSLGWHNINANKLGLQLNLAVPESRQVVLDLARWADVLIEAFAPGVMERRGLGLDALRAENPQLITVSTSLFGHSGPLWPIPGFGNMGAAMGGFYGVTGWPDRLPAGPFLAYTDATSPRLTAVAILSALEWRRRHGRGLALDFSQAEGGLHFMAPALVDDQVNDRVASRAGNRDPEMAPHGVFPAGPDGEDRWLAIACENDTQWAALAALAGRVDLGALTLTERFARQDELEAVVGGYTAGRPPLELEGELQAAGIAAHQVLASADCIADAQLLHRDHYVEVPHAACGHTWAERYGYRLTADPGGPTRGGPTWGEHNDVVLGQLLGYDDDRITELVIGGALE